MATCVEITTKMSNPQQLTGTISGSANSEENGTFISGITSPGLQPSYSIYVVDEESVLTLGNCQVAIKNLSPTYVPQGYLDQGTYAGTGRNTLCTDEQYIVTFDASQCLATPPTPTSGSGFSDWWILIAIILIGAGAYALGKRQEGVKG